LYEAHFKLKEQPFSTQPDPRFAYETREHQIALAKIGYAADQRKGLALLTGPVGTGKTTIANRLVSAWAEDPTKQVGFLPSASDRTKAAFLRLVLSAFGIEGSRNATDSQQKLFAFLLGEYDADRHPVLLIDEGQNISHDNIDTIADITNFQTAKSKLITVVILAQDNFPNKLERKPAFRSRIAIRGTLDPLTFEDMRGMIGHRLGVAGRKDAEKLFPEAACHVIYTYTRGVPRDICVLCDNALIETFVRNETVVSPEAVTAAAESLHDVKKWDSDVEPTPTKRARKDKAASE
jgi:general secretion pathway protein A